MQRFLVLLIAVAVAIGAYAYFAGIVEAPIGTPDDQRIPSVEEYVRQNIAMLSPEPAVLGGTLYVTEIEAKDGRGTVWYEDGHIALVADFEYIADKYGITVTSFEVRK
ncbi:MAG TPA: hypothetical protein VNM40_00775 [Candidatus Paceibacterota bacterium]|nr:hypothetical protein [Candidatus Paceibacterota bacterium]